MNATAETERSWLIRGITRNGNPTHFHVQAFDHADAHRKAIKSKALAGGQVLDVILWERRT